MQTRDYASLSYHFKWLGVIGLTSSAETTGLYAIDTATKRVQNNPKPIYSPGLPLATNLKNLQGVVFADAATQGPYACFTALHRGLPIALAYKFPQRVALALQPGLKKKMENYWQTQSLWIDAGSYIIIGTGETLTLMPLDVYKTRAQTRFAPKAKAGGRVGLYTGAGPGWIRNFSFVAAMSIVRDQSERFLLRNGLFGSLAQPGAKPNEKQKHISRALGFAAGASLSSPFDVIKIRMQAQLNQQKEAALQQTPGQADKAPPAPKRPSAIQVGKEIWTKEKPSAFFKGITLKALTQSARLTVFFGVTDALMKRVMPEERLTEKPAGPAGPKG